MTPSAPLRVVRSLLLGIATALALLAALEGASRAIGWPDPGIYTGDPAGLWALRPNLRARPVRFEERGTTFAVRTNRLGWRDTEPEPEGLLCLGDSTTFGWGVEEDEAWPARLEARLGMPVHNAGVPGFSTHQGRQALQAALAVRPRAVLLAYLVRDAQAAAIPDAARPASTAPPDLQLLRLLRSIRPRPAAAAGGPTTRVPPEAYEANLLAMIAAVRAAGALPLLLAFPMRTPATAHLAVLRGLDGRADGAPLLEPAMPPDSWFEEDPIHLTPNGNAHLAEQLVVELPSRIAPRSQ